MITPRFSCDQTDDTVIVSLYCPSVRASDAEINVDDTLLTIHINPYFLRLHFPHEVVEDESSTALYDPSTGYLTITLAKAVKGQIFADLDLLAKLLAPQSSRPPPAPLIEVLESSPGEDGTDELTRGATRLTLEDKDEFLKAAENDWQVSQTVPETTAELDLSGRYYGFLDKYTGYFVHVAHTENEINELGNSVESCALDERRKLRITHENGKWDEEHYMADYADDEYIQELIAWDESGNSSEVVYTEEEKTEMLRLPRKEYITDGIQERNLYLTLITLLFAYAYDKRTTMDDPTPESAWTICSLLPAFSALDPPPYASAKSDMPVACRLAFADGELITTLAASYRRSLAFPLYRSFQLSEACRRDAASYMARGKRMTTRCLLEMKRILDHHEVYYVYSRIWLDDFCVWIQSCARENVLEELGGRLGRLVVPKSAIGWELERVEEATGLANCGAGDTDDE
ncbi:SHQ1 protein-domain-containing protein [Butyriboletus roseoflavus]|nr:SHQ1 protein-domain-containing protein [Butyriboletus roseoflavus]